MDIRMVVTSRCVVGLFGSPKQVEIVDLRAQGERTVESIAAVTSMTMGNTSRHLQIR